MTTVVIIGAGQAGGWVAKTLRTEGFAGEIIVIGDEAHPPHERPPLSKAVLVGDKPHASCHLWADDFAATERIEWRGGVRVTSIDRVAHALQCSDGSRVVYDKLVLANGARVRTLAIPGSEHALYLRTIDDSARLGERLRAARHATIIGGGWIGLEVAAAARKLGVAVTVLESLPRLCVRSLPESISVVLVGLHRSHGVEFEFGGSITAIERDGARLRVVRAGGTALHASSLATDVVVAGIGVVPNIELARTAGLEVGNGIVVDAHGQTSDPDIYAAGDVTFHPNRLLGQSLRLESWANAQNQGIEVGRALAGKGVGYAELPWFWSDQYDVNLQILGVPAPAHTAVVRGDVAARRFSIFYLEGDRVAAVIAVNAARDLGIARRLIARGISVNAAKIADPALKLDLLLR